MKESPSADSSNLWRSFTGLNEARRADISHLRDTLELTNANLSSNLQVLEQAGYVEIRAKRRLSEQSVYLGQIDFRQGFGIGIENPHSTRGLAHQPCPRSP